jgi:5'-nucleotidase
MNILITNDDGLRAKGINILFDVLSESHNVFMIAPDEEKSACSSAITVRDHLRVDTVSDKKYAVNGFPADCINIGLHSELLPEINMVISGINHGPNLGDDVYFSGTVAGARTALIFGVTGIALSLDCLKTSDYFVDAAVFITRFIGDFKLSARIRPICLNINYPDIPHNEIRGVKYTILGRRDYRDSYDIFSKSDKEIHMKLNGTVESIDAEGSDVTEIRNGYISITPLKLDCTDYSYFQKISK